MPHATGLRILAGLFSLTIIGLPIGVLFWWIARKQEKERKRELEALEQAKNVD